MGLCAEARARPRINRRRPAQVLDSGSRALLRALERPSAKRLGQRIDGVRESHLVPHSATLYAATVRFYAVVSGELEEAVEPISKGEGVLVVEEDGDLRVERIG